MDNTPDKNLDKVNETKETNKIESRLGDSEEFILYKRNDDNDFVDSKDKAIKESEVKEKGVPIATYTFTFPGMEKFQEVVDEYSPYGQKDYYEAIMENIIIPKISWDYWDNHSGYLEVMQAADQFLAKYLN